MGIINFALIVRAIVVAYCNNEQFLAWVGRDNSKVRTYRENGWALDNVSFTIQWAWAIEELYFLCWEYDHCSNNEEIEMEITISRPRWMRKELNSRKETCWKAYRAQQFST
jgi:poly(A) polymerase Pap1